MVGSGAGDGTGTPMSAIFVMRGMIGTPVKIDDIGNGLPEPWRGRPLDYNGKSAIAPLGIGRVGGNTGRGKRDGIGEGAHGRSGHRRWDGFLGLHGADSSV